jgi:hypothetical protein
MALLRDASTVHEHPHLPDCANARTNQLLYPVLACRDSGRISNSPSLTNGVLFMEFAKLLRALISDAVSRPVTARECPRVVARKGLD